MTARDRILARRAKLVAAAITGATVAACGSQVCLSLIDPDAQAPMDAAPDMRPQACLTAPFDSGSDTGSDAPGDSPSDSPKDSPSDQDAG